MTERPSPIHVGKGVIPMSFKREKKREKLTRGRLAKRSKHIRLRAVGSKKRTVAGRRSLKKRGRQKSDEKVIEKVFNRGESLLLSVDIRRGIMNKKEIPLSEGAT